MFHLSHKHILEVAYQKLAFFVVHSGENVDDELK